MQNAISRRQLLSNTACGFGSLALAGMLGPSANALGALSRSRGETAALGQLPHHAPRAKRVIFLFMQGGPSHLDTFDPKPRLTKEDGQSVEFLVARTRKRTPEKLLRSPWKFAQHGECGMWASELFPHVAKHADKLCLLRGMHTEGVAHGPATLFLHTGATSLVRPSVGAWVGYGLGTENQNLPAFVTVSPPATKGGPRNYGNAFLPADFRGTPIGRAGVSLTKSGIPMLNSDHSLDERRRRMDLVQGLNEIQAQNRPSQQELNGVINSYELAFRMQMHAPAVFDFAQETKATLDSYGIGEKPTDEFGRQCLLARRMAEAGVRYIQVNYADDSANPRWDQHSKLKDHEKHALATDRPVAALLDDLEKRGLLEDTLVWWGGEFGRTPFAQGRDGRDHNPNGFTVWLAGGGTKPGLTFGETDEYGHKAIAGRMHMHDLHATVLHLLGLDHKELTFQHAGRNFRLTDVAGNVVHDIIV